MRVENKTKLPALKVNEGSLQGGFKSLNDLQKSKIKGGGNSGCLNYKCNNSMQLK
ncbi:hypothetical protein [Apibacter sp. HY039]|uniref:hypothetical protein n=1 Tax=Apibacter sp. HY039 TaxID=2501476 RepID=UPI0013E2D31C|nr:hypothetical protein [Apibacter sp. HY039]